MTGRILLMAAVAVGSVLAQPKSQLSGFVQDSTGAPVSDAAISVINLDTGVRRSTRSNNEGFYAVSSLTPGQHKISVRREGFQTVARTGIPLHAMDVARIDFTLELGSLHEEITVEDVPALLNTADASYGMVVGQDSAESLPLNGRGLQALIDLAPGVLATPATSGEAGQFSANGQRPATNYFTVDGVSANNGISGSGLPGQFSGGALPAMTAIGSLHNLLTLAELDEMRVQTSTYAPEYGRLPGAQVAVTTRSGSNEFHGELFGGFRHERLAAGDWFANAAGLDRTTQRLTDIGGSIGGPIRRNQTFFLLSGEHIRLRQPVTFRTPVPSLAARRGPIASAFPLPNGPDLDPHTALHTARTVLPAELTTTSVRLDHTLGGSGTLFVRYNLTPSSNRVGYLQSNAADFRSQTVTVGTVAALGPRLTNDARVGSARTSVDSSWLPGAASIDLRSILPPAGTGQQLYGIGITGIGQLLAGDPGFSRQSQWNLTDTLAFTTGRHDIRVGIDYQRLSPQRDKAIASTVVIYKGIDELLSGVTPEYTYALAGGGSSLVETFSAFAQDTWHTTHRLNLNYGVRWEVTPAPSYRGPTPSTTPLFEGMPAGPALPAEFSASPVWESRLTQFAPRVGAAYRLTDNLVLRAGAGVFYDLGFSSAVDMVNGGPYNRWRAAAGVATLGETIQYGFARDLKLPYTAQWNVTLDRLLSRGSALSVGYVGADGRRLLRREGLFRTGTNQLVLATNNGGSNYHSLQVNYRSRNVRGLQGTASYTWSHAIDNGSWDSATWLVFHDSDEDLASSNFDVRHSFQAAWSYELGRTRLPFVRHWLISGTLRARTGFPVDVITTEHLFGLGFDNELRPDLVPGVPVWLSDPAAPGGRRLNPAAFTAPNAGRQGTLGRNTITGNGLAQLDLALRREFVVTEQTRLEVRLEGYNVTNWTNFADPVRILSSPLFGTSASMTNLMLGAGRPNSGLSPAFQSGGPRTVQAGLTVRF
jgi:hypothetical protein